MSYGTYMYKLVYANAVPYLGVWESAKTSEKIEWGGLRVLGGDGRVRAG